MIPLFSSIVAILHCSFGNGLRFLAFSQTTTPDDDGRYGIVNVNGRLIELKPHIQLMSSPSRFVLCVILRFNRHLGVTAVVMLLRLFSYQVCIKITWSSSNFPYPLNSISRIINLSLNMADVQCDKISKPLGLWNYLSVIPHPSKIATNPSQLKSHSNHSNRITSADNTYT